MDATTATGVPALLSAAADADGPLLTYVDEATGERVDLSASALAGWAARSAGLLTRGCGLGAGSRAAVLLPAHWQTAAVLLGAWSVGVAVSFRPLATAGLPALGLGADEPLDVTFVARHRVDDWLDHVPDAHHRFVLNIGPTPSPGRTVPDSYRDFLAEARTYPDSPAEYAMVRPTDPASVDGTSYQQWGGLAQAVADRLELRAGDRLLVDASEHEEPVKWLLAPLAAGASVVVYANLDRTNLDARIAAENITRVL